MELARKVAQWDHLSTVNTFACLASDYLLSFFFLFVLITISSKGVADTWAGLTGGW